MRSAQDNAPQMSSRTMIGLVLVLLIMMIVMSFRDAIGGALDFAFRYISFDGRYPVLTLIIAGVVMITVSTVVRSLMSDPIQMAKNQQIQRDFNQEFRQARMENNLFKMKKLQEMQPQITAMSMEASTQQMKIMPVTMVILMPVYAWVYFFVNGDAQVYFTPDSPPIVNLPWDMGYNLASYIFGFFPTWIIIYTMVSLPLGQIENRLLRYYFLRKHLRELDLEVKKAEREG